MDWFEYDYDHGSAEENWAAGGPRNDSWWHRVRIGRLVLVGKFSIHHNRSFGDLWIFQPEISFRRKRHHWPKKNP